LIIFWLLLRKTSERQSEPDEPDPKQEEPLKEIEASIRSRKDIKANQWISYSENEC
jgi:hypothetical protein